ncbi:MAG: type II toxin-antitoxin system VapC family toxin [Candidatus Aminicenantes bacterium]|nr:type II toxin-antitoxin system VapC family toxin [Candidatus Aminicenantes bacterium]
MKYFFDTSALVKIYHNENGTEKVLSMYSGNEKITISELARIEFYSSVYRKYRMREIDLETLNLIIEKFDYDTAHRYEVLYFSPGVTEQALSFLSGFGETKGIRALDSLQLSFFKSYCEKRDAFVCADTKFVNIVKEENINVIVPLND